MRLEGLFCFAIFHVTYFLRAFLRWTWTAFQDSCTTDQIYIINAKGRNCLKEGTAGQPSLAACLKYGLIVGGVCGCSFLFGGFGCTGEEDLTIGTGRVTLEHKLWRLMST